MGLAVLKFGGDPHLGGDNFDDRLALWILYLLRGGKPEALRANSHIWQVRPRRSLHGAAAVAVE